MRAGAGTDGVDQRLPGVGRLGAAHGGSAGRRTAAPTAAGRGRPGRRRGHRRLRVGVGSGPAGLDADRPVSPGATARALVRPGPGRARPGVPDDRDPCHGPGRRRRGHHDGLGAALRPGRRLAAAHRPALSAGDRRRSGRHRRSGAAGARRAGATRPGGGDLVAAARPDRGGAAGRVRARTLPSASCPSGLSAAGSSRGRSEPAAVAAGRRLRLHPGAVGR